MSTKFEIHLRTEPMEMLQHPPRVASRPLMYCPICVAVKGDPYPTPVWCDAAGVLLLRWHEEIWKMSLGQSRAARLIFFDINREIWVRRTTMHWWKVSCVERKGDHKTISREVLCIPEEIEAALLQASQKLLAGARRAGVWFDDCVELASFLESQIGCRLPV